MESLTSTRSPRSPTPSVSSAGTKKSGSFPPLSQHGMPKTPLPLSSGGSIRPHRFSNIKSLSATSPRSPQQDAPMSPPPMSAKSFGTFIDSEPATPAYSPQSGSNWDDSTLVLLSPRSSARSSAPSSPVEPSWDMIAPFKKAKRISIRKKAAPSLSKQISAGTSLASHPVMPIREEPQKENLPPAEQEPEPKDEEEHQSHTAPLEKLAIKVKSILRRKNVGEKKRRREYRDLDRIEDVHWTEM